MPEPQPNRITDWLEEPDSNTKRFHLGPFPQVGVPTEPEFTEEEQAAIAHHEATIHAPTARPRFGTDEEGNPIEVPTEGLVITDPLTGSVEPLSEESAAKSEKMHAQRAEEDEARRSLRLATGRAGPSVIPPAGSTSTEGSSRPNSERTPRRSSD